MTKTTPRSLAMQAGEKYYHTGVPCKKGHLAPRATATGTCVRCTQEAAHAWIKRHPEKSLIYAASYRERHKQRKLENDRRSTAKRRLADPVKHNTYRREYYRRRVAETEGRDVLAGNRTTIDTLRQRLAQAHGGALEYVDGLVNMVQLARFRCAVHGIEVESQPHNVLRGANPCPRCNHTKSSQESAIAKFLSIFTPVIQRDRALLKPRELDMYLPAKKLAVEYCGMYWHSHGDKESERENRHRHFQKYKDCQDAGVRLITVFESDWNANAKVVKRMLRNAIGASKGRLMARKCTLQKVPVQEARQFYERYHPQGGAGYGEHYGLYWRGKLVACMRFVLGANDRGAGAANRVWTLGRYATRITVAGAASRLFAAFLKEFNPSNVKSFSDNRFFDGGMYRQLGFALEEEIAPDYQVWSPKTGIFNKAHYQRRNLPARLAEHGLQKSSFDPTTDSRSEAEITYLMGARRIYDCGKKRWVWKTP